MANASPKNFLYDGSPFLAGHDMIQQVLEPCLNMIKNRKLLPLHAIAHQICNLGESLSLTQLEELNWLNKNFKSNINDVDWFYLGYTTAPTIIIASCTAIMVPGAKIFSKLAPAPDVRMKNLNSYKIDLFGSVFSICQAQLATKPQPTIDEVYKFLSQNPHTGQPYYILGQVSSHKASLSLAKMFEDYMSPLQTTPN